MSLRYDRVTVSSRIDPLMLEVYVGCKNMPIMEHRWHHVDRSYFVSATLKVNEIFRGWQYRFPAKDVRFVVVFFLLIISAGSVGGGTAIEYEMTAAQCVTWKDICM